MLAKVAIGLAIILATVSGSLASTRNCEFGYDQTIYNPNGAYIGAAPVQGIRDRAHAN
jgi:hypothetical protein